MTRYAIRLVETDRRPEQGSLYAKTRRSKVRGLGTIDTYSLGEVHASFEPTTWAHRETAQKWADKFSSKSLSGETKFEVVEYQRPKYVVGEGVSDEERATYLAWCSERGLRPTVAAEIEYVNEMIAQQSQNA